MYRRYRRLINSKESCQKGTKYSVYSEDDLVKHLTYMGCNVSHQLTPVEVVDNAVINHGESGGQRPQLSSHFSNISTTTSTSKLVGTPSPHGLPPQTPRQRTLTKSEIVEEDYKLLNLEGPQSIEWQEIEKKLLQGYIDYTYPENARLVRIFTSSTFTDTRHERNTLMENVYPKLKEYCRELGYEFQIVDMRWGVRDEASNDHTTTELCMSELEACRRLSTGPYFVTFLSHKYGYRPFPRVIEAPEFENILKYVDQKEDRDLLLKWFKKDENAVPVSYVLQPISTYLPDFLERQDKDKVKVAKNTWWDVFEQMTQLLATAASKALTKEKAHKYLMSVTENEIAEGILKAVDTNKHCFWYNRKITGIDQQPTSQILSKYRDGNGLEDDVNQAQDLLNVLKQEKLPQKLPDENILTYTVPWSEKGIDPEHIPDHRSYLQKLSIDFERSMKEMILSGIRDKAQKFSSPLMEEILQHVTFCNKKCEMFHGREDTIKTIKSYIEKRGKLGPCVVYGESGSGKTSVMAMVAKLAQSWLDDDAVVVARFVGTTGDSSNIRSLLLSILQQLSLVYNVQISGPDEDESGTKATDLSTKSAVVLGATLEHFLRKQMISMTRPLVLILDSLDQLSPDDNPESMNWLPPKSSRNVRIILSTLPDSGTAKYGFLPKLQEEFTSASTFIPVPQITPDEVTGVLNRWLSVRKRHLTSQQVVLLTQAFDRCPIPLYLNLCFERAVQWTSYQNVDSSTLKSTVEEVIAQVFSQVELKHGFILTSHILAYITASRNGLSEAELEDILSCDEEVLNDVYQYWTPPVRRLPPLLLVRVKSDLQQYLVERGSEGTKLIYWYHRQFVEAARQLYLNPEQPDHCRQIHRGIAEFFLGRWADTPKPFTNKQGQEERIKRFVAAQLLKFKDVFNTRKLQEMPEHLMKAGMVKEVQETFYSLDWLTAKIKATSFYHLVQDVERSLLLLKGFPEFDYDSIYLLLSTLRLSQNAIVYDLDQLPAQILGRLSEGLDGLRSECLNVRSTHLLPSKAFLVRPGEGLQHQISDHTEEITGLDISKDAKYVITCSEEPVIHVWNADTGVLLRKLNAKLTKGYTLMNCTFCFHDKKILLSADNSEKQASQLFVMSFDTGSLMDMAKLYNWAYSVYGEGKCKAAVLHKYRVSVTDLETGDDVWGPVKDSDKESHIDATEGLMCANDEHICFGYRSVSWFKIVNVATKEVSPRIIAFPSGGPRTQAVTVDTMAISPDKGFVLVLGFGEAELKMYDLKTRELLKTLKADDENSIENLQIFPGSSNLLVFQGLESLYLWNLDSPQDIKQKFTHPKVITRWACSEDKAKFVTVASDNSLRIWFNDANKDNSKMTKKKHSYGSDVNFFPFPQNERYLLVVANVKRPKGGPSTDYWFEIHDLITQTIVKSLKVSGTMKVKTINFVTDTQIVIADNRRIKVIDLSTSKVEKVLNGILPKTRWYICLALKKSAVVSLTRSNRGVKVMSLKTGEVTAVIKSTGKHKLNDLLVSADGSVAVTSEEEKDRNHLVVFNLIAKQVSHMLSLGDRDCAMHLTQSCLTKDGAYLVNEQYGVLGKEEESYNFVYVWDVKKGEQVHCLHDKQDFEVYHKLSGSDADLESPDVSCSMVVEAERPLVVQVGNDSVIRVFDVITGDLQHKFQPPPRHSLDEFFQRSKYQSVYKQAYIVSCGALDDSFWIYDTKEWCPLASFKSDISVSNRTQIGDGSVIVGWDSTEGQVLMWYLSGTRRYKLTETTTAFQQLGDTSLELSSAGDDFAAGADDPDKESDVESEDDDMMDEDDSYNSYPMDNEETEDEDDLDDEDVDDMNEYALQDDEEVLDDDDDDIDRKDL